MNKDNKREYSQKEDQELNIKSFDPRHSCHFLFGN